MTRLFLAALLALAPALPAAAQVRAVADAARTIPSAPIAIRARRLRAPHPVALGLRDLAAAGAFSFRSRRCRLGPRLRSRRFRPRPRPRTPLHRWPTFPPRARAITRRPRPRFSPRRTPPPSGLALRPPTENRPGRPPQPSGSSPSSSDSADGGANVGPAAIFDGARDAFGAPSDPGYGKRRILPGMPGVAVRSVQRRAWTSSRRTKSRRSARSRSYTRTTSRCIVREAGRHARPHRQRRRHRAQGRAQGPMLDRQLCRTRTPSWSRTRSATALGLGAVVLRRRSDKRVTLAARSRRRSRRTVRSEPAIGFARVYVFHGSDLKTYARGRGRGVPPRRVRRSHSLRSRLSKPARAPIPAKKPLPSCSPRRLSHSRSCPTWTS
jgi:hypothetical protein